MSRAFIKEDVDEPERHTLRRTSSGLPPGALNLMTAEGARQLRARLADLAQASPKDDDEAAYLEHALTSATIVEPRQQTDTQTITFGSSVTLRTAEGGLETYRIVGVDEEGLAPDNVSWLSPLGKALLASSLGRKVRLDQGGRLLGTVEAVVS